MLSDGIGSLTGAPGTGAAGDAGIAATTGPAPDDEAGSEIGSVVVNLFNSASASR